MGIRDSKKTALGLVISNAVYVITFNVFICIILNNAINSALNQLDPSMSRYAGMSFLPFLLVFAGAIICVVFSVLTVIWEKDTTKAIAAKAKVQLLSLIHILKISKSEHAAVVCDSKKGEFYLVSSQGSLTYLNGQTVNDSVSINTGDNIEVGDSIFIFIAFCTEERRLDNI